MDVYMENEYIPGIAGVLEKLAFSGEDDESHFGIAEHRDLVGFLQQTRPPLRECHLPIDLVLNSLQLHSSPPHFSRSPQTIH